MNLEKASFTPLVFTTSGGMAPESEKLYKQVAETLAQKSGEKYADVVSHIRRRLRFALLRSVLMAVRGVRGRSKDSDVSSNEEISFNLIPHA